MLILPCVSVGLVIDFELEVDLNRDEAFGFSGESRKEGHSCSFRYVELNLRCKNKNMNKFPGFDHSPHDPK